MSVKANILSEETIQNKVTDNGTNSEVCFISDIGLQDDSNFENEILSNKIVSELAHKLNAANSNEVPNRQSEIQLECENVSQNDIEASYFSESSKKSLPNHETDQSTFSYGEMLNKEVILDAHDQISSRNCSSDLKQDTQENESSATVDSKQSISQDIGETVSNMTDELKSEKSEEIFEGLTNSFLKNSKKLKGGNDFDINSINELNVETVHNINEDAKCIAFDNFNTVIESADHNGNENISLTGNCKEIAEMNVVPQSKSNSDIEKDIDAICNLKHLNVACNENPAMDYPVIENELGQDCHCENITASNSTKGNKNFEEVDLKCESKVHSGVSSQNFEKVDLKCETKEAHSDVSCRNIEVDLKCDHKETHSDVSSRNIENFRMKCERKEKHSDVSSRNFEKEDLKCENKETHSDASSQNFEKVDLKCETKEAHSDLSSRNFENVTSMESLDTSEVSQQSKDCSKLETEHNTSPSYSYRRALNYFQNLCDQRPPAELEKNNLYEIKNQQDKFAELTAELQNAKRYFSDLQSDISDLKKEILEVKVSVEKFLSTVHTSDEKNTGNN